MEHNTEPVRVHTAYGKPKTHSTVCKQKQVLHRQVRPALTTKIALRRKKEGSDFLFLHRKFDVRNKGSHTATTAPQVGKKKMPQIKEFHIYVCTSRPQQIRKQPLRVIYWRNEKLPKKHDHGWNMATTNSKIVRSRY